MNTPYSQRHQGGAFGELLYASVLGLTLMAVLTLWWWYVMR